MNDRDGAMARTGLLGRRVAAVAVAILAGACGESQPAKPVTPVPVEVRPGPARGSDEADRVTVHCVLLPTEGSGVPGDALPRAQARTMAFEIAAAVAKGESLATATASKAPAIPIETFVLANTGVAPTEGAQPRGNVERGLGDAAFSLSIGEARVVEWSHAASPLGFRVVVRID